MLSHPFNKTTIGGYSGLPTRLMVLIALCYSWAYGQSPGLPHLNAVLLNEADDIAYIKAIDSVRSVWIAVEQYDSFQYLDYYVERLRNRKDLDNIELRNAYGRHAHAYGKYTADLDKKEHFYLLANQYYNRLDTTMWTWIENGLGITYHQKGDLEKAIYFYLIDLRFHEKNKTERPRRYSNIARAYADLSDYGNATFYYNKGINIAVRHNQVYDELFLRANKANMLVNIDSVQVIQYETSIIEHKKERLDDQVERATIDDMLLDLKSYLAFKSNQYEIGASQLKEKFELYDIQYPTRFRREYAKLCNQIAQFYIKIPMPDSAKHYINQGFYYLTRTSDHNKLSIEDIYPENTFMELYETLADHYISQYKHKSEGAYLDSALHAINTALSLNQLLEAEITLEASSLESIEYTRELIEKLIFVYDLKKQNGQEIKDIDLHKVFTLSKGTYLNRLQRNRAQLRLLPSNDSIRVAENLKAISELKKNPPAAGNALSEILRLQTQNDSLLGPSKGDLLLISDRSGSFIDFIVGEHSVYALDNFSTELRFSNLGSTDTLVSLIQRFHELIHAKDNLSSILHLLYNELLLPFEPLPSQFHVYPDDLLSNLPFDVLINSEGHYLLQDHLIVVKLNNTNAEPRGLPAKPGVVCLAPYYGKPGNAIASSRGAIGPLLFAEKEVTLIQETFQARILEQVNFDSLDNIASQTTILHFAGHAQSDDRKGHLATGAEVEGWYPRITGDEIALIPWNLDLAVLSACETGLGQVRKGEGTMSLARAFHEGGTRNVVSTLWSVNDVSSSKIISHFYEELKRGKPAAKALQNAKRTYLSNTTGIARHPYYWAGFFISSTEELPAKTSLPLRWIAAVLLTIIGISFLIKKYTK